MWAWWWSGRCSSAWHGGGGLALASLRKHPRLAFAALAAAPLAVLLALSLPDGSEALSQARRGKAALAQAEERLRQGEPHAAHRYLSEAVAAFRRARAALDSPLVVPASVLPGVRRHVLAARAMAQTGEHLARAGVFAAAAADEASGGFQLQAGAADVDALHWTAEGIRGSLPDIRRARELLETSPGSWLFPPLQREREDALHRVVGAEEGAERAVAGLEAAPALLGTGGTKRYFLAFANASELRGTGGLVGYYAILEAREGKLSLLDSGRPSFPAPGIGTRDAPEWLRDGYGRYGTFGAWSNLNISSDFPTTARLMVGSAPASVGRIDGVVQLDPAALSVFLGLTGPVSVPGWPEPLTASNVERVTQRDAYVRFADANDERIDFLGDVVDVVFAKLLSTSIDLESDTLDALGTLARGGHVQVYSTDPAGQEALATVGVARSHDRTDGATDVLGVVGNNFVGNKIDWFLRREVAYDVSLDPTASSARTDLRVTLRNDAPATGLPGYVIGSQAPEAGEGTNRDLLVVLRPRRAALLEATNSGDPVQLTRDEEGPLMGFHHVTNVPPDGATTVEASFLVPGALSGSGRDRVYRLYIPRQPVAHADRYAVRIDAPWGWSAEGETTFEGPLEGDEVLEVRLHQSLPALVLDTAVLRPFRIARGWLAQLL